MAIKDFFTKENALPSIPVLGMTAYERAWAYAVRMSTAKEFKGSQYPAEMTDLQKDVFWAAYQERMVLEKAPVGREINHELMKQLQADPEFQSIIWETYNDFYLSESSSVYITKALYREDNIQKAMQKQKEANESREKAAQAQGQAREKFEQMAKDAIKAGLKLLGVDPDNGEEGEGQAVGAATRTASDQIEDMNETLRSWGFDKNPSNPKAQSETEEIMKLAKRQGHDKIATLAGKVEGIGIKSRRGNKGYEPVDATLTQNIEDIFPEGLEAMTGVLGRAERIRALSEYLSDGLLGVDYDKQQSSGYGPFLGYGDESGSTSGTIDMHIKSILLGLALLAQREGRQFEIYGFDGMVQIGHAIKTESSKLELMQWASTHADGGTNFNAVLVDAHDRIRKFYDGETELYGADVILATDGQDRIDPSYAKQWMTLAKETGARLHVLIVHPGEEIEDLQKRTSKTFELVSPASTSFISSSFKDKDTVEIASQMALDIY